MCHDTVNRQLRIIIYRPTCMYTSDIIYFISDNFSYTCLYFFLTKIDWSLNKIPQLLLYYNTVT